MRFPSPRAEKIIKEGKKYYVNSTFSSSIIVAGGNGPVAEDVDGYRFLDLHCDASVNNLGRANKKLIEALEEQIKTGNIFSEHHNAYNVEAVKLAKFLALRSPVKKPAKVFLSNSGAEANEAARKACRAYRYHNGERKRTKAIYFTNGFAGRTKGVLSATSSRPEAQRDPFWDHCDRKNSIYLPYPRHAQDWSGLKKAFRKINLREVDRLLIELPCQGEGGIIPCDEEALKYLYKKTQKAGVSWIADAVQCGMGRTGTLFGCDYFPWLEPDVLTLGKALGGGWPIGATVFRADLDFKPGEHSNTFGGHPAICRVANVAVKEFEKLIESGAVKAIENMLKRRTHEFWKYRSVVDLRGQGAMWAVEFATPELCRRFVEAGEELALSHAFGLRLLTAGRKSVRIMPPLNIKPHELKIALDLFEKALKTLA